MPLRIETPVLTRKHTLFGKRKSRPIADIATFYPEVVDSKYILEMVQICIRQFKRTTKTVKEDQVALVICRMNTRSIEAVLMKDIEIQDFQMALHVFIKSHPDLKITESNSLYPVFISACRELWHLMLPEQFDSWILPFFNSSLAEIKMRIKQGIRVDSRLA